jgi:hypothetical protein
MAVRASFRLFRTGLISSTIVGLAAGGHLAGGGTLPAPAILAAVCALTVLSVAVLTKIRLSLPVLTVLLGAGQAWLHWAFHALSQGAHDGGAVLTGHGHHIAGVAVEPAVQAHAAAAGDGQMFAAHAVATIVTAVLLARGEKALWLVTAWLRPLVRLPLPFVLPVGVRPAWPTQQADAPPAAPALRLPARRGPPPALILA